MANEIFGRSKQNKADTRNPSRASIRTPDLASRITKVRFTQHGGRTTLTALRSRNVLTQSSRAAFLLNCKHQLCEKHALQTILNHPSECSGFTTCRCARVPSRQHNNATTPTKRSGSQHKRQSGTFHGRSEQFCPRNNSRGYRVSSAKRDCGRQWRKLDVVVSHHIDESHSGC